MRKLNKKQKELLARREEWNYDDLPEVIRIKLETLNWYETLWSDTDRFLTDNNAQRRFDQRQLR